jgi:hypothetical protein
MDTAHVMARSDDFAAKREVYFVSKNWARTEAILPDGLTNRRNGAPICQSLT